MSFFDRINESILGGRLSDSYVSGIFYTMGDVQNIDPSQRQRTLAFGGNRWETSSDTSVAGKLYQSTDATLTGMQKFAMANTAANAAFGFYTGGFSGMYEAVGSDIAVSSALARHGHSSIDSYKPKDHFFREPKSVKTSSVVFGKYVGQSFFNKVPVLGSALNAGSFINKAIWSGIGYGVASNSFGTIGGSIAGMYGAHLGAKYSGALTVASAAVGATALVGYGAYSILQAGLNHRQNQRSVQFAGDMSAFSTSAAATQRARAVQAMQKSHMNARSALGQEATYYSGRNYFRRY